MRIGTAAPRTDDRPATPSSTSYGDSYILATNRAVMTLGGYQGWDRIVTPAGLVRLVANGTVRYFYLPANDGGFGPGSQGGPNGPGSNNGFGRGGPGGASAVASSLAGANDDLATWVQVHCTAVPSTAWQTSTTASGAARGSATGNSGRGSAHLYDCVGAARP